MPVCLSCNPRFQRGADLLHGLAFLADPARCHSIEADTAARLDEWRRRLTPDMAAAAGGLSPWWCAGLDRLDHSPPAPWPDWLLAAIAPPVPPPRRGYPPDGASEAGRRLDAIMHQLGNAREGERNGVLFWAACRCAEMQLPQEHIEALLTPIALGIGLREFEIQRTVASAIRRVAA